MLYSKSGRISSNSTLGEQGVDVNMGPINVLLTSASNPGRIGLSITPEWGLVVYHDPNHLSNSGEERCPLCDGSGRLIDVDLGELRELIELKNVIEDALNRLRMFLMVLPLLVVSDLEKANEWAQQFGMFLAFAKRNDLIYIDEKLFRREYLACLREARSQFPDVEWEDLRRVTVALFPWLQERLWSWRAFMMACRRSDI